MPPDSGASSHISGERTDSTLEPLVGRRKEAGGVAWAAGSIDDECRVPRIQSCTEPQPSFNWEGRAVPIKSHLATSVVVDLGEGGVSNRVQASTLVQKVAVSRQAPVSLGAVRLKKTWKGTLEQQDGHNNKPNT